MVRLTLQQRQMYYLDQFIGKSVGNICGSVLFSGVYDTKTITNALNTLFFINDALRIRIIRQDESVFQTVSKYTEQNFELLEFKDASELNRFADSFSKEKINIDGDLCNVKIVRAGSKTGVLFKIHHLIGDAWSLSFLGYQLESILNNMEPEVGSYIEYVDNDARYTSSKRFIADVEYFTKQIASHKNVLLLSDKSTQSFASERKSFSLGEELTSRIIEFSQKKDVRPFAVLLTAAAIYFGKIKNSYDFYFGMPILNRTSQKELNTAGLFMNTVPVLISLDGTLNFFENIKRVTENSYDAMRHSRGYWGVMDETQIQHTRLFDVIFSFQNAQLEKGSAETVWYPSGVQNESLQIHVEDRDQNGELHFHYDFHSDKFTQKDIDCLHKGIECILSSGILSEFSQIDSIPIVSDADRKLLDSFNVSSDDCFDTTIVDLFQKRVTIDEFAVAVISKDSQITYGELDRKSSILANSLIKRGVKKGSVVAILLPRGIDVVIAQIGVLKTGAAYLLLDTKLPEERISFILDDSRSKTVITSDLLLELLKSDDDSTSCETIDPEAPCYFIYTSGSTGTPKGICISHRNLVNHVERGRRHIYGDIITEDCRRIASIASVGFDMYQTESILPLMHGMTIIMADEEESIIQSKLNSLLLRYPADVLQTTPTKLVSLINDKNCVEYLRKLKVIMLGGEPLDSKLVAQIRQITDARVFNLYGPTETTVWATYSEVTNIDEISIGKPLANVKTYIVNEHMQLLPFGVLGELCLGGLCVGKGYINRKDLTAERFLENPFDEGFIYRTGDLAYQRDDGNIFYVGRNDRQVKLHGLRIELEEIESVAYQLDGINRAAVVLCGADNSCLKMYYTGVKQNQKDLREKLRKRLPYYMVPHKTAYLEIMPMTPNGKIDLNSLPDTEDQDESVSPEVLSQEGIYLAEVIKNVCHQQKINPSNDFYELGGDSLRAIELVAKLEQSGYILPVWEVLSGKTIKELSQLIRKASDREDVASQTRMEATPAQKQIYYAEKMSGCGILYNVPFRCTVQNLDEERLKQAIAVLLERHSALRSTFSEENGTVYQIINRSHKIEIEHWNEDALGFVRPFDLNKGPLMRVGISGDVVLFDFHHLIFDGASVFIFMKELNIAYSGRKFKNVPALFENYLSRCKEDPHDIDSLETIYENPTDSLQLSAVGRRSSANGDFLRLFIGKELHRQVIRVSSLEKQTPFSFYLTAFTFLIKCYSKSSDMIIGVPFEGRTSLFSNTIGMFVNTRALRCQVNSNESIRESVRRNKDVILDAMSHLNDSGSSLNEKIPFGKPIQVMIDYEHFSVDDVDKSDVPFSSLDMICTKTSKFELSFHIMSYGDNAEVAIEYSTDLMDSARVKRIFDSYCCILRQMLDENRLVRDVVCIGSEERLLLDQFNNTFVAFERNKSIYDLFEEQFIKTPDRICLSDGIKEYSYSQFHNCVERLDTYIRTIIGPEKQIIGILADRSIEMYLSIYAVIRGGNAYLPILPSFPQERIDYMLQDSGVSCVLTQDKYTSIVNEKGINVSRVFDDLQKVEFIAEKKALPEDIAYVIYTSGSSGRPKGVQICNRSVVNRITWMERKYSLGCDGTILQKTPYTFDVSVWEIFWWGMFGGKMVFSDPEEHFLPGKITEKVYVAKVTHLHFVPSVFAIFIEYLMNNPDERKKLYSIKHIFLSGERLYAESVRRFGKLFPEIKLHNLYGPTECTVDVTYYDCIGTEDEIPIGKPIDNTQIYIVDEDQERLPLYTVGELCIAGEGVGMGYQNLPLLTLEKFTANPFGKGHLYHTGDLAYQKENGDLIYCGRMDRQIKINGQRIEPEEIENVLLKIGADRVVVEQYQREGKDCLVVFFTGTIDEALLSEECGRKLPSYMMPAAFVKISEIPLDNNGKVDRKKLPYHLIDGTVDTEKITEPINETEQEICEIFKAILQTDAVGRNTNFISMGGTSLEIIQFLSWSPLLESVLFSDFLKDPTPAGIAKKLAEKSLPNHSIQALYTVNGADKTIIMLPYAGGNANSFSQILRIFKREKIPINLYYSDFIHSNEEYHEIAQEIAKNFRNYGVSFYAHCAGSVVAMKLIHILEQEYNMKVDFLFSSAFIPVRQKRNIWDSVPDIALLKVLTHVGSSIKSLPEETRNKLLDAFRKDVQCSFETIKNEPMILNTQVCSIISKKDIFTRKYRKALKYWEEYLSAPVELSYIKSKSHYFQTDQANVIVDWMVNKLKNHFTE